MNRLLSLVILFLAFAAPLRAGIPHTGLVESFSPGVLHGTQFTTINIVVRNTGTTTYFRLDVDTIPTGWSVANLSPAERIINSGATSTFQISANPGGFLGDAAINVKLYVYEFLTDPILIDNVNLLVEAILPPGTFFIQAPFANEVVPFEPFDIAWTIPGEVTGYDLKIHRTAGAQLVNPPVFTANNLTSTIYTYDMRNLDRTQEYAIVVDAKNEVGKASNADGPRRFTIEQAVPPGVFDLTSPTSNQTTSRYPSITWTASANAQTYTVNVLPEVNGQPVSNPVRTVPNLVFLNYAWTDPPLEPGAYYVSVLAVGEGGTKLNRQGLVRFVVSAVQPFNLLAPDDGVNMQPHRPTFRWQRMPGADKYCLLVLNADETLFDFQYLDQPAGSGDIEYQWKASNPLKPAQTFIWYVAAFAGSEFALSNSRRMLGTTPLRTFDLLTPESGSVGAPLQPEFTWEPAPAAIRYQVQVAPIRADGSPDVGERQESLFLTEPEWNGSTLFLQNGTQYAWRVSASDGQNTIYNYGEWQPFRTTVFTDGFNLTTPANGATGARTEPILRWESVGGATGYRVAIGADGKWLLPYIEVDGNLPEADLLAEGIRLNGLTKYYWTVWALADGEEKFANQGFEFTTRAREETTNCDVLQHLLGLQSLTSDERLQAGVIGELDAAQFIILRNLPDAPSCD